MQEGFWSDMVVEFFKRFGFAAIVTALALGLGLAVVAKGVLGERDEKSGQSAVQSTSKGAPKSGGGPGGGAPIMVVTAPVKTETFYEALETIGTAQAKESITITAKVTDVIRAIRFESGDRVARGQVLVELANVEQAADLQEAQASLEVQRREYDRFRALGEKGYSPAARVEEARAAFERAQARVDALRSRIADRTIRAPFAGVMGLRTASPGALARPGEPIGTLDDISSIRVDLDVSETQLSKVKVGGLIAARTAAFPGVEFPGKIESIDSRVNPVTRTLRARALAPNPDGRLKPGMLLAIEVRSNPRQGLAAPEIALIERESGASVFAIGEREGRKIAQQIPVETGARKAGLVEITAGLEAGQDVIVEGVQRVRDGGPVRLQGDEGPGNKPEAPQSPARSIGGAAAGAP